MISVYRPGRSPLHRCPPAAKVLLLFGAVLVVSLLPSALWLPPALVATVGIGYALAGAFPRELLRQTWALRWMLVLLGAVLVIFHGWGDALVVVCRIWAAILLASLVTLTTPAMRLLEGFERLLAPIRRFGVSPERVALAASLAITSVPVLLGIGQRIREAQRARGARFSLRSWGVPLIVMALAHADALADALSARGAD